MALVLKDNGEEEEIECKLVFSVCADDRDNGISTITLLNGIAQSFTNHSDVAALDHALARAFMHQSSSGLFLRLPGYLLFMLFFT